MWLIEHTVWNDDEEYSYIKDVVDTYDNLVNYFKVLAEHNSHMSMRFNVIPRGEPLKHVLPLLEGSNEHYSIIRFLATNVPTENV